MSEKPLMTDEIVSRKFKLFFFLPIYSWKKKGNKKKWKIFGLPILKRKIKSDGHKIKYYLFSIPIMTISKK